MKILVTGCAGFIGMHVARRLLDRGDEVIGIDNLNDYYDPSLKLARLAQLQAHRTLPSIGWTSPTARRWMVCSPRELERVVHLAAQAGVRYSLKNPHAYIHSNVTGFLNCWRHAAIAAANTCFLPALPASTARTANCRSASTTTPITRSACMPRPRRATS